MEVQPREIRNYRTPDGREPFTEWLDSLRDMRTRVKIEKRLEQIASGNLGNYRSVGEGVCEFKINFGPGYRVYFAFQGSTVVIILCGGDKSTQEENILEARKYWRDYERPESTNK
jgi:putative addiction module killer protein